jgi:hypothetical protein
MRLLLICLFTLIYAGAGAQDSIWFTRSGHIYFISHTPILDIDANHYQVGAMLNVKTGDMAFSLLMKSFEFTLPLAEEHFNENYVESEKFPKSTFKGRILNFDPTRLAEGTDYRAEVEGDLLIHGVTKKIREPGILRREGDAIKSTSEFTLLVDDFRIKIPSIVADRVATEIPVKVEILFKPMVR